MNKPEFNAFPSGNGLPFSIPAWNALGAFSGPLGGWMNCFGRLQNEIVAFAQARFRRDVAAMERLARCRRPDEVVEAQAEFLAQLYSDYAKENLKVAGMFGDAAQWTREQVAGAGAPSP